MPAPEHLPVRLSWASDRAVRIEFGLPPTSAGPPLIRRAVDQLRRAGIPGLSDLTPAYTTILATFDLAALAPASAEEAIRCALAAPAPPDTHQTKLIQIPVCYHPHFAPDLDDVAQFHGLSPDQVAALHSAPEYQVAFIGFSPGFPYLNGLPAQLATPRLDRPRLRVPAGSVAIAGDQTGIYPHATPGGWRLIGRTPLQLFDAAQTPPARLALGDRIRFVAIDPDQFLALAPPGEVR